MCVYACHSVGEYSALSISKINKDRSVKFRTQYQIILDVIFFFGKNQKIGSGIERTGNKIRSEYLKNGSSNYR